MRGATSSKPSGSMTSFPFQSTRPMRGATLACRWSASDYRISIHAPHAGRDFEYGRTTKCSASFQSTRPMRGATLIYNHYTEKELKISIHAPHAGRDGCTNRYGRRDRISIHAPHAGRDDIYKKPANTKDDFNPRAPCGARQQRSNDGSSRSLFQSTRPMRGATNAHIRIDKPLVNFNPRAPCGARQAARAPKGESIEISIHAPHAGRDVLSFKIL